MTDPAALKEAASGCDQAIHAAATFSYRRSDAERMLRENRLGTTTVLDAAIDAGCTGIVHVSSFAALLRPGSTLDHQSPLGVTFGESNEVIRDILRGRLPTWPHGGMQWVDVRDTAVVVIAALDQPGHRYLVPGETIALPHESYAPSPGADFPQYACRSRSPSRCCTSATTPAGNSSRTPRRVPGSSPPIPSSTIRRRSTSSGSTEGRWRNRCETPSAGSSRPATSHHAPPANVSEPEELLALGIENPIEKGEQ